MKSGVAQNMLSPVRPRLEHNSRGFQWPSVSTEGDPIADIQIYTRPWYLLNWQDTWRQPLPPRLRSVNGGPIVCRRHPHIYGLGNTLPLLHTGQEKPFARTSVALLHLDDTALPKNRTADRLWVRVADPNHGSCYTRVGSR